MSAEAFASWGWRIPFVLSILLLAISLYIRLKLEESPVFKRMKEEGRASKNPIKDTLGNAASLKVVMLAIFGAVAGQGVVWYTGHFYSLYFMTSTLKIGYQQAYTYLTFALLLGTPFFVFFGWLSDRIGRKWIMMTGMLASAILFIPIFQGLTYYGNPALHEFRAKNTVIIDGGDCREEQTFIGQLFQPKATKDCTRAKAFLSSYAVPYEARAGGKELKLVIGGETLSGYDEKMVRAALDKIGLPKAADPARINGPMITLLLFMLVLLATMVYGPIGAFLVELFPTKVRYSGVSVAMQIGNGWIGGFAPFFATMLVVSSGNIFTGLLYTVAVAAVTFVIGSLFIRDTRGNDINQ
jgi:MFS family permease